MSEAAALPKRRAQKWTKAQHRKFKATMAAKRKAKQAGKTAKVIPLHAIPADRPKKARRKPKPSPYKAKQADNRRLAEKLIDLALKLL